MLWLLGNLAGEQPTGAQKGLREITEGKGDCHSSTREGQQELNRVLLVFSTYLYKRSTRCLHVSKILFLS